MLGLLLTYSDIWKVPFRLNGYSCTWRSFCKTILICLLIVRYMLSDKIKGKSALKARTFLHVVHDKVHACYWYRMSMHLLTENSAGYLQRVQIFLKPFIGEIFTYKKHPIHRNSSAMIINMDFLCQYIVTDIKQTCLGQGLGVTITARKRTSKVKNLGIGHWSYAAWSSKLSICK